MEKLTRRRFKTFRWPGDIGKQEGFMMSEVIFSFDNSSDAARAGILMNQVDPSLRYTQMRTTVCVLWHANIIAATQAVLDAGIPCTFQYWNDIKNSHRRG
ncbi:hypothetical protein P1J85_002340 [Salmonella enterica]|nr:hypothetical protein [Salmonella enterica]ECS7967833.1 hypothetical protein [Salmonella enterica subsp. enterica serovar Poona]EAR9449530.1 hypothetical protein [Salmonella enterica]EAS3839185.1 hypothetical protein [Salmonella enterica]EAW8074062.1 hypothetical protein [Salmonella enterica]